ncbi:SDR family oxidoreductase [Ruegeria arenilitoris]|uniref:SDR family oxidoreductase n=1 Tax=Ruegeria arenilitoris TaxID=1173585 RepID=UPI001479B780|nr:SDR family oxidoreductase [Ruegeria arenilitoris]
MAAKFDDTLAIVTGAGSGLGRALCHQFAERGIRAVGVARLNDSILGTKETCKHPENIISIAADVSDHVAAERVFHQLDQLEFSHLILINNASVYDRYDFATASLDFFEREIKTNFGGAVSYSHLALQRMIRNGQGRIINVGSFADQAPLPGSTGYSVSKGALRLFSAALVADVGKRFPNIIINDWVPGMLDTKMGRPEGLDPKQAAVWGVELALLRNPELNGLVFDMNQDIAPQRSLKRRVAEALGLRPKHVPVFLD